MEFLPESAALENGAGATGGSRRSNENRLARRPGSPILPAGPLACAGRVWEVGWATGLEPLAPSPAFRFWGGVLPIPSNPPEASSRRSAVSVSRSIRRDSKRLQEFDVSAGVVGATFFLSAPASTFVTSSAQWSATIAVASASLETRWSNKSVCGVASPRNTQASATDESRMKFWVTGGPRPSTP